MLTAALLIDRAAHLEAAWQRQVMRLSEQYWRHANHSKILLQGDKAARAATVNSSTTAMAALRLPQAQTTVSWMLSREALTVLSGQAVSAVIICMHE